MIAGLCTGQIYISSEWWKIFISVWCREIKKEKKKTILNDEVNIKAI